MICKCIRCGKEFESNRKKAVCPECQTAFCVVCGKEFELKWPYTAMTCSSECRAKWVKDSGISKKRAEKAKETLMSKYGVSNASELQKFKKICKYCGKEFETTSARQEYCNDVHYGNCPVCGKKVVIKEMSIGPQACSEKCRVSRIKSTCEEKYGNPVVLNSDYGRKKSKESCLERYGVDHYSKTDEYKEKVKETNLSRYGVEYALQNDDIKEKQIKTNNERYGGNSPTCNDDIKNKIKNTVNERYGGFTLESDKLSEKVNETMIERYGVENAFQSEEIRNRAVATLESNYGVTSPLKSDVIFDKVKETNFNKYGNEYLIASEKIRNKSHESVLSRYGVDNIFQSEEIKNKISETLIDRYGVDNPMKSDAIKESAMQTNLERYGSKWYGSSFDAMKNRVTDTSKAEMFRWFSNDAKGFIEFNYDSKPTLTMIANDTGVTLSAISYQAIKQGVQNFILYNAYNMEEEVIQFLKSVDANIKVVKHNRSIIYPYEIDIYLPDYKIGIECNPTCTHNSSINDPFGGDPKSRNYHKKKSDLANNKGVFLFHIFGYEWTNRKDIVKSMLKNLIGRNDRKIYARNTYIKEISNGVCKEFLEKNHLYGSINASVRIGLFDKKSDKLVSVMTFNKMRGTIGKSDSANDYELSRFCNLINTSVVGGASKILHYFINHYSFDRIVSYSSLSNTKGNLYSVLGFNEVSRSKPSYKWVNLSNDFSVNRLNTQKKKLKNLFIDDELDLSKSESEIMIEHGFVKVYDCGVKKWVYDI